MKIKLHRPKRGLWNLALLSFLLGIAAYFLPVASGFALYFFVFSALLLLLGTWIIR
jgi:hypothetical protein